MRRMATTNYLRVITAAVALALAASLLALVGFQTKSAQAQSNNTSSNQNSGDARCTGVLTGTFDNVVVPEGQTCFLTNSTVRGNVTALPNSHLRVNNNTIHGNVKALLDSNLDAFDNTIRGNVEGDKANSVNLVSTDPAIPDIVGGNIEAKEGAFFRACHQTMPNGNIQVEKFGSRGSGTFTDSGVVIGGVGPGFNCGPSGGNTLSKGNIKVEENTVTSVFGFGAGLRVDQNRVAGDLQVFKNRGPAQKTVQGNTVGENLQCKKNSPPFVGGPNAAKKAEGQCF